MPVDFIPLILAVLMCIGLLAGATWSVMSRHTFCAALASLIFLVAPWPAIYAWLYCRADILYSFKAAKGDPEAEYRLGFAHMSYYDGTNYDPEKGDALLQRAADAGNARAQMTLACFIVSGLNERPDDNRALALLNRAAPAIPDAITLAAEVRAHHVQWGNPTGIARTITYRWIDTRR
jgi:TPR repeat protein